MHCGSFSMQSKQLHEDLQHPTVGEKDEKGVRALDGHPIRQRQNAQPLRIDDELHNPCVQLDRLRALLQLRQEFVSLM